MSRDGFKTAASAAPPTSTYIIHQPRGPGLRPSVNGSDDQVWTTDKDGLLLALLAAEITAVTGRDPREHCETPTEKYGDPSYTRIDVPTTPAQKQKLSKLEAVSMTAATLAGDPIDSILTHAPANNAPIGGVKVSAKNGWFAARPSGTENIYKVYAESFQGPEHLSAIVAQAQEIVTAAISAHT